MAIQTGFDTQLPKAPESVSVSPVLPISDKTDRDLAAFFAANPPTDWFSLGYMEAEYTFYAIQTTYQTDLGLQAAPSTAARTTGPVLEIPISGSPSNPGSGQSSSSSQSSPPVDENQIVRVRRPITFKTVNWTAQRLYVKPLLPHWNTGTTNEKLLSRTISARNPLQSINKKTWEVSGQYVYAFKKEPYITVNQVEYFILPSGRTTAESNIGGVNGGALHAYTEGDFSFMPLNASWIPVNAPLPGMNHPVGFGSRTGTPDFPPRQDDLARMGQA